MEWYKQQNPNSQTLFPNISEADGIDLRAEMKSILYGSGSVKPKGHWVTVRHYDRDKKSKYYNKYTKEGVGGPAHPYTDVLVRSRRIPYPRTNTEDVAKIGDIFSDTFVYYLEYTVTIRNGDQIYELDIDDHTLKPSNPDFLEKYDIKRIHPYRLENGNTQYFAIIAEYNNVTY